MAETLANRILSFLERHSGEWVASGDMQRVIGEKTTFDPRSAVRRMQEMAKEGLLEVEIHSGHAFYRHMPKKKPEFGVLPIKELKEEKKITITSRCSFCQEEKEVSEVLCVYCKNKKGLVKAPVHKLCDKCFLKGHTGDADFESPDPQQRKVWRY